jgi:TPR repeat protein
MIKKIFYSLFIVSFMYASHYDSAIELYKNKEFKKAAVEFEKSANNKNSESSYILGYLYTGGIGVKADLKQSLKWYEKAAKAGHTNAQVNLGFMYIAGHGTKVDYKKAAHWIGKAKEKGNQKASIMWNEFKLYEYGNQK